MENLRSPRLKVVFLVSALILLLAPRLAALQPKAVTTTSLAVTAGGSPVTSVGFHTVITLTATVMSGSNPVTPGQVNFCDATAKSCTDIHLLGTAQVTPSGTATLKFIPGIGSHSYKAAFLGTNTFAASSATAVLTVMNTVRAIGSSITTIAQSGSAGNYTLTATVTGFGTVVPTGQVSFLDTTNSNFVLGTASLAVGQAGLIWANSQSPATGNYPLSVAVGDFNGDGIPDLVVANDNDTGPSNIPLTILLGNGDGTFTAVTGPVPSELPTFVAVGDFNGDGKADLAVTSIGDNSVSIFLGNGDGTFNSAGTVQVGLYPESIAVGDYNHDGIADLAVANATDSTVSILLGNGDGTFTTKATLPTGFSPQSIATADFNGDGILDLATANIAGNTATVLLGNGDGTFTLKASPQVGGQPKSVVVGDFNGDGIPDLAIANSADNFPGSPADNSISVLLGNGDGTFTATAVNPAAGSVPSSIAIGDFNGDGLPDLAIADFSANMVTVLLGNGDGAFTASESAATGIAPWSIAAADFNGDGLTDLAVDNSLSNSLTILLAEASWATATVTGISPVGTGIHLVDASYAGDSNYDPSISATTALNGLPVATTLSLSAIPSISSPGQAVVLTATLSPFQAQNQTATGTVTFYSGSNILGTGTIQNGVAMFSATTLPQGSSFVSAKYSGDTNFDPSTSPSVVVTVGESTSTILTASPTALALGQSTTLTATVTANGGAPSGTITFLNGTVTIGTATLNAQGVASLPWAPTAPGAYSITASYGGSAADSPSVSSPVVVTVSGSTATALTASPTSMLLGQPVTLTATVTALNGVTPTGTVTFLFNSGAILGTATLNASGVATLQLTLSLGVYTITATYGGSPTEAASAPSPPVTVTVTPDPTTTVLTSSENPAPFSTSVTFTATVTGTPGTAAGTVSFLDGTAVLGTASLVSGVAAFSTSSLSTGSHSITAVYASVTDFLGSTSNVVNETITATAPDFTIAVSPASQSVYTGQPAVYTVTVTSGTGFNQPVSLACSGLPAQTTCAFSPGSVNGSGNSTLTVQTTAPHSASTTTALRAGSGAATLAGLFLLFLRRGKRRTIFLALLVLLTAGAAAIGGCSAPASLTGGTPVGAQTITVTGTVANGSQMFTQNTTFTLNVNSLF
jgi:hypothetical protein